MTSFRLPSGGLIDRDTSINFTFDGDPFQGLQGDTLASALMANGQMMMGRSFKYHRPRGPVTASSSEPNALMEIGEGGRKQANTRATTVELHDGLVARSQNRWPSLEFDVGAVNALASSIFVAGFYYKTFMWPKAFWEKIYEPLIRRAAGLGSATYEPDPDRYEKAYAHCDVLVIGAGPSGLMAAHVAARAGSRVILLDEDARPGGALLYETHEIDGKLGAEWTAGIIAELEANQDVTIMARATAFGWYDGNIFGAVERVNKHVAVPSAHEPVERYWRIIAKRAVLATGAEERPLVFGGNDRPGVMQATAASTYANRYGVAPGRTGVVFTNNSSGYQTAEHLAANGVDVAAVLDTRADAEAPQGFSGNLISGAAIFNVKGAKAIKEIKTSHGAINCDFIAMSGGWNPRVHLSCHRGAKPEWNDEIHAFVAPDVGEGLIAAGAAAGHFSMAACLKDGAEKGARAASGAGFKPKRQSVPKSNGDDDFTITPLWYVEGATGKAFVDFQNDVTSKDIPLAAREGYRDVELAKRYTTTGMATDQGKLSNINAIGLLAEATGKSIPEVGTTTFRPFYVPVSFGTITGAHTGHHFQPVRKTPLHEWAKDLGAVFVETGLWYRSQWFPQPGEKTWLESVIREVETTRSKVGICDVSTLGKIDVQGKDAPEFMNRLYSNGWKLLKVGRARYGLMLREDGIVFDDGTASRLAEDHYFMTTTTANAARVMSHMEFCHQALWPELDVQYVSVTEQWSQMAVAGPFARKTLRKIVDVDLSDEAFPFMGARPVNVLGGIKGRLFRISFSGELAYELSVPADYGDAVARAVMHAGEEFGIAPYGTEALSVMRIEKGHVAGGELNGTSTAYDLGLGGMMSSKKDFIGRMMATRDAFHRPDREQVVGLKPVNKGDQIRSGSHLLKKGADASMANDQGYVTSVAYSPMVGQWIALGFLKGGQARHGEVVRVWDGLRNIHMMAEVCHPVFYDKENAKLHG